MLTTRDLALIFIVTLIAVSVALLVFFLTPIGATVLAVVVIVAVLGALVAYFARSARTPSGPPY